MNDDIRSISERIDGIEERSRIIRNVVTRVGRKRDKESEPLQLESRCEESKEVCVLRRRCRQCQVWADHCGFCPPPTIFAAQRRAAQSRFSLGMTAKRGSWPECDLLTLTSTVTSNSITKWIKTLRIHRHDFHGLLQDWQLTLSSKVDLIPD